MDGNLTASDVALLTGNNRNDGMFGGDGAWWLIVLMPYYTEGQAETCPFVI